MDTPALRHGIPGQKKPIYVSLLHMSQIGIKLAQEGQLLLNPRAQQASLPLMLFAEAMAWLNMNDFSGLEVPFVVVFINFDDSLGNIPLTQYGYLFGRNGVLLPGVFSALDVENVLESRFLFLVLRFCIHIEPLKLFVAPSKIAVAVLNIKRVLILSSTK
ncbi:MAG: hypothetical protein ACD_75C01143G0006 [uncultured bacterium]|nr:MAG: hypothetical protein ACD_75C01143G0006 [uncultured bacterium]